MISKLSLDDVELFGSGLKRPEGVMVAKNGDVWAAHGAGHCVRFDADGKGEAVGDLGGTPNGICLDRDGSLVIANIGGHCVQRLHPDGRSEVITDTMEERPFMAPNFPFIDTKNRLWVTNSTALRRQFDATRIPIPDGSLCVIENGETRIVAEGIRFANGVTLDEKEEFVYVAETMGRCIIRYAVNDDGSVGRPEPYGPELGERGYPDGCAFDTAGNLWVTLPAMNAIGVMTPEREWSVVLHDPDGVKIKRPTNLCFGGEDLRTAYIGSLSGTALPRFTVPHPGMRLVHQMS